MYTLLVFLSGALQSGMSSFNGILNNYLGEIGVGFTVHFIGGLVLILYMKLVLKQKLKITGMPWYLYTAGLCGFIMVAVTSHIVSVAGTAAFTCLSVTGQLVLSAVVDHFGWFGVEQQHFTLKRIPGFLIIFAGILLINIA